VSDIRPAWSAPFLDGGPGPAPYVAWPGRVTRRWAYGDGRAAGVKVAIVDSGVDAEHPAVAGVARAVDVVADRAGGITIVEGPHEDRYGHGTACAGLIRRVAPGAELISVRVLGADLRGNADCLAAAIDWCIEAGVDVVNLSLSSSNERYRGTFWELVDRAAFAHVCLVSAMSNERKVTIPSELAGVFSVACGSGHDLEAVWCNPRGPAEWAAPGIDLEVAWSGGRTMVTSGNSIAAAVVSGHVARVVGAHPGVAPWQVRAVLAAVARNASNTATHRSRPPARSSSGRR